MPRKRPIKLMTLDTETIGLDGDLKRIAVYDGVEVTYGYVFNDVLPVIEDYHAQGYSVHIYIHNLEFDARKINEIFKKDNVLWSQTRIIDGKFAKIVCKKYVLHDSFKLLPESLASLSKSFGLEHGKLDLWEAVQKEYPNQYESHVDFLNRCDKDNSLYLEYLGYDVISLYELIEKLCEVSGLSVEDIVKCISTASMSKQVFKNGFKGKPFKTEGEEKTDFQILTMNKGWTSLKTIKGTNVTYQEIEKKIRAAYFGGRVEVFKPYLKCNGYHYDFNSLYPSVMIDNLFPVGIPSFYDNVHKIDFIWRKWQRHHSGLGFIKCKVFVPEQHIPPLPVKIEKLVFPCGYLEGTWTFHELEYAVKNCGVKILEFEEMIYFSQTFKVFHNYVKIFSDMKEQGKETGQEALVKLCKLLLNTSYGWTCLIREKTALNSIEKEQEYKDKILYKNEELGYFEYESFIQSETIQPQVGAYVTSYARLKLLDILREQYAKGEIYYCDTDSIVCSAPIDDSKVHHSKLGYLDLEGELTEGVFLQPKVYSERLKDSKEKVKFKGVTKARQREINFDFYMELKEILATGEKARIKIEENTETLRSILYSQKKNRNANILEIRDKYMNTTNKQKRIINYTDNYTLPWFMSDLDMFHHFTFKPDYSDLRLANGNLIDITKKG